MLVLRTTAGKLVEGPGRAAVAALHQQAAASLYVMVDTTICSGLACDARWLGRSLGIDRVWGYTACDIRHRWPSVRWPNFEVTKKVTDTCDTPCQRGGQDFTCGQRMRWLMYRTLHPRVAAAGWRAASTGHGQRWWKSVPIARLVGISYGEQDAAKRRRAGAGW